MSEKIGCTRRTLLKGVIVAGSAMGWVHHGDDVLLQCRMMAFGGIVDAQLPKDTHWNWAWRVCPPDGPPLVLDQGRIAGPESLELGLTYPFLDATVYGSYHYQLTGWSENGHRFSSNSVTISLSPYRFGR